MASKVVLAQAVTTAVPAYVMQGVLLPSRVHNKLDKLTRDFIWGSSIEKRKLHLVSWEKVVRPKENGGLGIHVAKQKNFSLTDKLCWRFKNSKGELWAKTLKRKYVRRGRNDRKNFSRTWAAIKKSESLVQHGSHWLIGNNSSLSFWYDKWHKMGPLQNFIQGSLPLIEEELIVSQVVDHGRWNLSGLYFLFPSVCWMSC